MNLFKALKSLDRYKLFKVFHYCKTGSYAELLEKTKNYISKFNELNNIELDQLIPPKGRKYEKLRFKLEAKPMVSIVIPVYNKWHYTYNCLEYIQKYTDDVAYEVIIGDDVSTDETRNAEKYLDNVIISRNEKNCGFLKNCNKAAKLAKGKYICFLNNDTCVQNGWLSSLVNKIECEPDIGLIGSKLVYTNGRIQEAGGILWCDGSAWNYGNGQISDLPEYNYLKDVDYISGASILTRKDIWEKIGGFDERYAPAYCEDADYAFEVRKAGYRVVYQPESVVVHFEGISNGKDIKKGIKKYQVENQKKFLDKWRNVLHVEHFENGMDVFWARDRSRNKKTIIVIDHYVPHYDRDAGGRTIYQYMQLLLKMGYNLVFVGDNYFPHQPYTKILQQMGIEVLAGEGWSLNKFEKWFKEHSKYINYVYLNRPHIAVKYIDIIKKYSNAGVLYYDLDLHFLREQREYEITKDASLLKSSKKWQVIECEIISKSDVVNTAGIYEESVLKEMFPDKNIHSIPIYLFEKKSIRKELEISKKNDNEIMFVGGFAHNPNVDAVEWLAKEIMPLLVKKIPDVKVYVIGSNPPKKLLEYQDDNLIFTGYVDDETLNDYYAKCKVDIVPLRFGAGVKGKVIEGLYQGIPIVTTDIGIEGIPDIEDAVVVGNSSVELVEGIVRLMNDDSLWIEMVNKGWNVIEKYFTTEFAEQFLRNDFEGIR